jgi:hypothetical protein
MQALRAQLQSFASGGQWEPPARQQVQLTSYSAPSTPLRQSVAAPAAATPGVAYARPAFSPLVPAAPQLVVRSAADLARKRQSLLSWVAENRNQNTARTYASGWAGFERYLVREGLLEADAQRRMSRTT